MRACLGTITPSRSARRALLIGLVVGSLFLVAVDPAAAQDDGGSIDQEEACNNDLMTTVQNATLFLTFAGPSIGGLNAGFNMLKASATNKSSDKKEHKENIKSSLMYGMGLGMLMGIINLVSSFGPMATC